MNYRMMNCLRLQLNLSVTLREDALDYGYFDASSGIFFDMPFFFLLSCCHCCYCLASKKKRFFISARIVFGHIHLSGSTGDYSLSTAPETKAET
jgi:hypothetical protein